MSIIGVFTHTEGILLHDVAPPQLKPKLRRLLDADLIPDDCEPKTVIFRDEGDGLRVTAISYDDATAADRAFEALWAQLGQQQDDAEQRRLKFE